MYVPTDVEHNYTFVNVSVVSLKRVHSGSPTVNVTIFKQTKSHLCGGSLTRISFLCPGIAV